MISSEWTGVVAILALTFGLAYPLGGYIARVYKNEKTFLDFLRPFENGLLRLAGIKSEDEYDTSQNLKALVAICVFFFAWAYSVLLLQNYLPFNPDGIPAMSASQAFNTAVSFVTNTNLQHYSGETGAAYFTQLAVFCFLQFVSAACGMAAAALVFRAITQTENGLVGNFYVYFLKSCTRILGPLALIWALFLVGRGVPATMKAAAQVITIENDTIQVARGPVAPMVAIKQLGTNGGGYFGPNSTHPFENPDYASNIAQTVAILILPVSMLFALGAYTERKRIALTFFAVSAAGFLMLAAPILHFETTTLPALAPLGLEQSAGVMEGKETRLGPAAAALWGVSTTCTSNGSVNGMHDSFAPASGAFLMLGMMVNAFFGGVGVGWLNFYIFLVLGVFIAGLMIGRTPELFGKKITPSEVKIAALVFLLHPFLILSGTAIAAYAAANDDTGGMAGGTLGWLNNPGFHGFSEMLYEFTSSSANNGSGFEGLGDNTPFWNISTGLVMLIARFLPIIGPVVIAGMLATKKSVPETPGALRLDSPAFAILLFSVIIILSALAFFPALALGPLAEFFS